MIPEMHPRRGGNYSKAENKGFGRYIPAIKNTSLNTSLGTIARYFPPSPLQGEREGGKYLSGALDSGRKILPWPGREVLSADGSLSALGPGREASQGPGGAGRPQGVAGRGQR